MKKYAEAEAQERVTCPGCEGSGSNRAACIICRTEAILGRQCQEHRGDNRCRLCGGRGTVPKTEGR